MNLGQWFEKFGTIEDVFTIRVKMDGTGSPWYIAGEADFDAQSEDINDALALNEGVAKQTVEGLNAREQERFANSENAAYVIQEFESCRACGVVEVVYRYNPDDGDIERRLISQSDTLPLGWSPTVKGALRFAVKLCKGDLKEHKGGTKQDERDFNVIHRRRLTEQREIEKELERLQKILKPEAKTSAKKPTRRRKAKKAPTGKRKKSKKKSR